MAVLCALLLALAAPASAAVLRALPGAGGCLRDAADAPRGCAGRIAGLAGASALALAPDGRNLYVAAADSDTVVTLLRAPGGLLRAPLRPSSGACVTAPLQSVCSAHAAGLDGADAVLVSPDGRNVYVGSLDSAAVVAFARGRNGLLAGAHPAKGFQSCLSGNPFGGSSASPCHARQQQLHSVAALAQSADGRFLYAVSYGNGPGDDSVLPLRRDPRSGGLRALPAECVASLGGSLCKQHAPGLRGASAIALSPDGRSVYIASALSNAIVALRRDPRTGALTPVRNGGSCVGDASSRLPPLDVACPEPIAGLRGARAVAVSPDGRFVYAAAFDTGSVVTLRRDPASGAIAPLAGTPGACLQAGAATDASCTGEIAGLRGADALAVSADGRTLYVAGEGETTLTALALSDGIPALPAPAPFSTAPLAAPSALALGPAGTLYVASSIDDAVAALEDR